jgi:SAM-dependent methyltransferase
MNTQSVYAAPQLGIHPEDCFFYHTMEIPGHGLMMGQWDLRETWQEYLGNVDFKGKRVLEIGTADGFICFNVERLGAQVVAFDLSENESWDLVPFARYDYEEYGLSNRNHIRQLNNAYWLCHRAFNSNAKMVYGNVYSIPREIGAVDISIFGSVLLHVRDPFSALENALRLTRETVIIAEPFSQDMVTRVLNHLGMPYLQFQPQFRRCEPKDSWWFLPPATIKQFIGVLGFEDVRVHRHVQQTGAWGGYKRIPYYTVVGRRTAGSISIISKAR